MLNFEELSHKLFSLVIFRNLLNDDVIKSFTELADEQKSEKEEVYLYADFLSKLFAETDNFSKYVLNAVLEDENAYILKYGHKKLGSHYDEALNMELDTLNELVAVRSDDVKKSLRLENESLPGWTTEKIDVKSIYLSRIKNISKTGYGIWAKYHVFIIKNGDIVPVKYPDTQKLSDFSGYERERSDGDDVHIQDTMQELTSLSARFGLQITFSRPDKNLYSGIVVELAKKYGINMPEDKLIMKAEAHALRAGGRSPRTARQFIEYLAYKQDAEKE